MRDFLKLCETPAVWMLFFATSVYGHVALKVAVDRVGGEGDGQSAVLSALACFWGLVRLPGLGRPRACCGPSPCPDTGSSRRTPYRRSATSWSAWRPGPFWGSD